MSKLRYLIAAGVSFSLHASILFGQNDVQVADLSVPAGQASNTVALNFVSMATSAPKPLPATKPLPAPRPLEQKAPTKKPEPKKTVAKKATTEKPTVKKQTIKKQTTKTQTSKAKATSPANKPSTQGANAKPMLIAKPQFLQQPTTPSYPKSARKRGLEGVVTYEVWLDEKGRQIKQVLVRSSGVNSLDRSALNAIKKWKFSPYTVNNKGIPHRVQIPINFKLDS